MTNHRAHAIGADHELGLGLRTIGERKQDAVAALFQSGQPVSQMDGAMIEPPASASSRSARWKV